MVDTAKLRGLIAENGMSQRQIAEELQMTPKTFYKKMKSGDFDLEEAEKLIGILGIKNPCQIFFAQWYL